MKRIVITLAIILATLISVPLVSAESTRIPADSANQGTLSGRIQSLSMYRDYEQAGNGTNSSIGVMLSYNTPVMRGFEAGLAYNYAGGIFENNNAGMLANDDIHVLNEAWLRFDLSALNLTHTNVLIGRKVIDGEIFRADDYRQKARAIEGVHLDINDIPNTRLTIGHALRMSNWIQSGDKWAFNDLGDHNDGITWGESTYGGLKNLEIAVFDAYSWNVANLVGARIGFMNQSGGKLAAFYRHEGNVGRGAEHTADAYGISATIKVGAATIEPGYFAVHGDGLLFQEATTGINHPLGASMMIFAKQFSAAADTVYVKARAKIARSTLYALYNYTRQRQFDIDGQELNIVLKYSIANDFTVSLKSGIGYLNIKNANDKVATDTRLFMTYKF